MNTDKRQNAKYDEGKLRPALVPSQIIWDIAKVREYGIEKYGSSENWKSVEMERYVNAFYRHFLAFVEDHNSVDPESGIEHYKHMACNMAFICWMMVNKKNNSERPSMKSVDERIRDGEVDPEYFFERKLP